jgi:hypothetical protein
MPALLSRSLLSRGDLRLFLSNDEGYSQDAYDVRWTVYDLSGNAVSGYRLPATRSTTGEYYAPWYSDVSQGNYEIEWAYWPDPTSEPVLKREKLYVVDPGAWPNRIAPKVQPAPGGLAYWIGSQLGRGDLPLFLTDESGLPAAAYACYWTIYDLNGIPASERSGGVLAAPGEYYAPLLVNLTPGRYSIVWEFTRSVDSPFESATLDFQVLGPYIASCGFPVGSSCSTTARETKASGLSCAVIPSSIICGVIQSVSHSSFTIQSIPVVAQAPSSCCVSVDIPRTIHYAQSTLPAGGAFTSQLPFPMPLGTKRITFYITYTRGAPGGYGTFRLMWGNGVEEVQETVIDTDLFISQPVGAQNLLLQDLDGPVPTDGYPISFTVYASVPGGATHVRLLAAERGMTALPGTIKIVLTGSG